MDSQFLEEIGMTQAEAVCYLALLKQGPCTAGSIIAKSGYQNSTVHKILNKLVQKGHATYVLKGKRRTYRAVNPETLLEEYKRRAQSFEEKLPELRQLMPKETPPSAEVYEGYKGLKAMFAEFIKDTNPGDEYLYFAFIPEQPKEHEYMYRFFKEYDKDRADKKLVTKAIAPKDIREKYDHRDTHNVKFVDFPTPHNLAVCNDKILMISWGEHRHSFLITSQPLSDMFRELFYSIWDTA